MVARDSRWAAQFVAERNLLGLLPGRFAAIEPVGSTAVAQPSAKPIFDLLAAVSTINEAARRGPKPRRRSSMKSSLTSSDKAVEAAPCLRTAKTFAQSPTLYMAAGQVRPSPFERNGARCRVGTCDPVRVKHVLYH